MAPEQFQGKAVFASDLYSLGVTMYQMLTGVLPYDAPAPSDLDKLMSGELVSPPRLKNPAIPKRLNDIVLRAMAPEVTARYQRAADLLEALLELRPRAVTRPSPARPDAQPQTVRQAARLVVDPAEPSGAKPRDGGAPRFCWQCRKPLHARTDRCPFCGEQQ
jgi:serine/threonine-protein kinase